MKCNNISSFMECKNIFSLEFWLETPCTKKKFKNWYFGHVPESKRHFKPFFKPKLLPNYSYWIATQGGGALEVRGSPLEGEGPTWRGIRKNSATSVRGPWWGSKWLFLFQGRRHFTHTSKSCLKIQHLVGGVPNLFPSPPLLSWHAQCRRKWVINTNLQGASKMLYE